MKAYVALLLLVVTVTCCGSLPQHPKSAAGVVRDISAQTVALLGQEDGAYRPYCTGVWVSRELILTAEHCASALLPVGAKVVVGFEVTYIVQAEVGGLSAAPKRSHQAQVLYVDKYRDLAILHALGGIPGHRTIRLAEVVPEPGDNVHCVGQDSGFYWTYMRGVVSGKWSDIPGSTNKGPWFQVMIPAWLGMSGGGAFDDSGKLIGITHGVKPLIPNLTLYIHTDSIRIFLSEYKRALAIHATRTAARR